ncbi:MAG: asparaginase [Ruminococcaceae bacterium]|nr:asparaginase [Oscillospiraceae bacterium]
MKKILFIATGGTIACSYSQAGLSPEADSSALLACLPELKDLCDIDEMQPFQLDSTNMSPREWTTLAGIIQRSYTDYDGFVIAHGTDTLAYGAAALSCLIQGAEKPIVMTGSQLPMEAESTDAKRNLRDAFHCACSELKGIAVVFCGRVIDGSCAKKVHTRDFDAFRSMGQNDLGIVQDGIVTLYSEQPDTAPIFFNRMDTAVAVVKLIPALDPDILDFAVQKSRVLIIEGFGTGGFPDYGNKEFEQKIAELVLNGIIVVMTTQVLEGGCDMSLYEVGKEAAKKYRIIEARRMTTEMAAMKAMWALAYSYSAEDFADLFLREI